MGVNFIEIILDTSESMGKRVFYSVDTTKLDIFKSILLNLFNAWISKDCGHKLYIRYSNNFDVLTLENIENLKYITTNGKIQLSDIINTSIKNLNTLGNEYENKVILILTDGNNNYDIKEVIDDKIVIYTMMIGDSENKNLTLNNLLKNSDMAYFYNKYTQEIDEMQSKIKKYFKCKKILPVGLFSIFFMFILPVIITFWYKGCEDNFSVNLFLTGCDNNSIRSQGMITKCSATPSYTPQRIKKDKEVDSNTTHCKPKNRHGILVKICFLKSNESVEATIYNISSSKKVIALKNFSSGMSKINDEYKMFLKDVLKESGMKKNINKIKIVGHTDLELTNKNKKYFFNKNCWIFHEKNSTNECLGKDRAFQVKEILKQSDYHFNNIIYKYDDDFFLGHINRELNNTLWKALELEATIDELSKKLNINKFDYDIKEIRNNEEIQNKIRNNQKSYRKKFTPFRSVVIIVDN